MPFAHAIVWLDHREARVIRFSFDKSRTVELHSNETVRKIHHRANTIGSGHAPDDHRFFDEIADAVQGVREVVLCGPGSAKVALDAYWRERHQTVAARVVGVETLDHPSEAELLQWAKRYFKAVDQLGLQPKR